MFGILTLITGLALSVVAAWFAIIGIMAIFAGLPIYAWLLGRLLGWENTRVGVRLARRAVSRLLAVGDVSVAWRWCERCLRVDTGFSVKSSAEALALATYARQAGRKKLAFAVLQPFTQETGEDFLSRDGMIVALRIASEDPAMLAEARRLTEIITRRIGAGRRPGHAGVDLADDDLLGLRGLP